MKKRTVLIGFVVALGILLFLLRVSHQERVVSDSVALNNLPIAATSLPKTLAATNRVVNTNVPPLPGQTLIEQRQAQASRDMQESMQLWNTPIEFYGKVVDEKKQPVSDVRVDYSCNDLSPTGTSSYHTSSDAWGHFSIAGVRGLVMSVHVSKDGYYTSKRDKDTYFYAGENVNFTPDASSPVVFHVRKMGKAEPLTAIAGSVLLPKDGTSVGISIDQAKVVPAQNGELRIRCRTANEGKQSGELYDWQCQLAVPGGGIQEDHDEFDFLAPESGYQPSIEIAMPASSGGGVWKDRLDRKYYLKLADGNYAKMHFEMITYGQHFCLVEIYKNPVGSRNLESSPTMKRNRISQ